MVEHKLWDRGVSRNETREAGGNYLYVYSKGCLRKSELWAKQWLWQQHKRWIGGLSGTWKETVSEGAGKLLGGVGIGREREKAVMAALGNSRFRLEPHQGELVAATCHPKHSPKSGPPGEDFCLLAQPCQASWDLWVERWPSSKRRKMLLRRSSPEPLKWEHWLQDPRRPKD